MISFGRLPSDMKIVEKDKTYIFDLRIVCKGIKANEFSG